MAKISLNKSVNVTWITAGILAVIYFCAYQTVLSHIIFYNEEHRLFLFSDEYLTHRMHWNGIMSVVTDFIVQFFYYPWLGSLIMALLLTGLYAIYHKVITAFVSKDLFQLAVIPSAVAFLYTMSVQHKLESVIFAFVISLVIYLIIYIIKCILKGRHYNAAISISSKKYLIVSMLFLVAYACAGNYYFWKHYNYNERRLLLVSHLANKGDWEKVRYYTENFLQSGRANNMMSYYYALALYHEGKLPDEILRYGNAIGPRGLFLAWDGSRESSEYGYLLYEQLGLISIAERWEFESMVVWGETAPHLINLIRYNLADNRPQVAQRFANVLDKSLFYRDKASQLQAHKDDLRNPLRDVKDNPAQFFQPTELTPNLEYLLSKDPDNKMAYEYLMCELILSNRLEEFAQYYPMATKFYKKIPQTFVDAMNYYSQNGSSARKEVANE